MSGAAAVLSGVALPAGGEAVNEDAGGAAGGFPGIAVAAGGVDAGIADAEGGEAVDEDVGGALDGGADDGMGAGGTAVGVGGIHGVVGQAAGGLEPEGAAEVVVGGSGEAGDGFAAREMDDGFVRRVVHGEGPRLRRN
jgi:hypothetical protein